MDRSRLRRSPSVVLFLLFAFLFAGCSIRQMALNTLGDALAGEGTVFSSDNDPQLVEDALPFSLKLMETVLAETPEHEGLLLALSRSFTQYSYAFVQLEADRLEDEDYAAAEAQRDRARKLYERGYRYAMRGLETRYPGFERRLRADPTSAAQELDADDVPMAYWTALSLAGAISLSLDNPELVGDLALVEALMERCLELDPDWDNGSIHSFFITYEMSRLNGEGDPVEKATYHFERAKALSDGMLASVYVNYAESVAVEQQDKELFVSLLQQALAIDVDERPQWRLINTIYQKRAAWLLGRMDWLFL